MPATLRSRIPQVLADMKLTVPKALEIGAEAIVEDAKMRAPVNTGRLRDSIHQERQASGGYYANRAVIAGDSKVFYGHMVEHGTTRAPAHPFLVPAFEAQRVAVEALVREALRRL